MGLIPVITPLIILLFSSSDDINCLNYGGLGKRFAVTKVDYYHCLKCQKLK